VSPPLNVIALVGSDVTFPCISNDTEVVRWDYHETPTSSPKVLYTGTKISSSIATRFTVPFVSSIPSSRRRYDLAIKNVELSDAGEYVCFQIQSSWQTKYAATLTVIGKYRSSSGITHHRVTNSNESLQTSTNQTHCKLAKLLKANARSTIPYLHSPHSPPTIRFPDRTE